MTKLSSYHQLRQLAQAATPGPWTATIAQPWQPGQGPFDDYGASIVGLDGTEVIQGGAQDEQGGAVGVLTNEDAVYIAAVNPSVVLALLDELEAAQRGCRLDEMYGDDVLKCIKS